MASYPQYQPYGSYQTQIDALGNKKEFAQALMSSMVAPQSNQNAFTGLSRILSAYLAKKDMGKYEQEQQGLQTQQADARRQELARVLDMTKDRPAETASPNVVGPPAPAVKGMPMNEALMRSAIPEFQDMGLKQTIDAKTLSNGQLGTYNPRDYTPASWAKFVKDKDPAVLARFSPQRNVDIGGVPHVFDPVDGIYVPATLGGGTPAAQPPGLPGAKPPAKEITAGDVADNKAIIAEAEAAAKARGESAGNQDAKAPVLDSLNYVMAQYEDLLPKIKTGGPLGLAGKASSFYDSQDAMRFENLNQQLSTELRTILRIPGEGSLSDQEQKQYGLQLPSLDYDEATNRQIMKDLNARIRLRLNMPVDDVAPQGGPSLNQPPAGAGAGGGKGSGGIRLIRVRPK